MARHANMNWNLPEGELSNDGGRTHSWPSIHASILLDIRDELQRLNRLLGCRNFTDIPFKLDAIKKNTTKRKYTRRTSK